MLGLNRTDLNTTGINYLHGFALDLDTLNFGNLVDWLPSPEHFGNLISLPLNFGTAITWIPSSSHFGNEV